MMTWLLLAAGALSLAGLVAVVLWLRRRPPTPMIRNGVLHELLLAAPIRLWALILAGPPLTFLAAWVVSLVRYGWTPDTAEQRIGILGNALYIVLVELGVIVVALAMVRLDAETRLGKFSIRADDDDDDRPQPTPDSDALPPDQRVTP
jgi:hypothetical protein